MLGVGAHKVRCSRVKSSVDGEDGEVKERQGLDEPVDRLPAPVLVTVGPEAPMIAHNVQRADLGDLMTRDEVQDFARALQRCEKKVLICEDGLSGLILGTVIKLRRQQPLHRPFLLYLGSEGFEAAREVIQRLQI